MRKKNDKNIEFIHFQKLSNEWWNPHGRFKVLHSITPLRIKYIKNNIYLVHKNITHHHTLLKGLEILTLPSTSNFKHKQVITTNCKILLKVELMPEIF